MGKLTDALFGAGLGMIGLVILFGTFLPYTAVYWIAGIGYGMIGLHVILYPFIFTRKYREKENGGIERIGPTRRIN